MSIEGLEELKFVLALVLLGCFVSNSDVMKTISQTMVELDLMGPPSSFDILLGFIPYLGYVLTFFFMYGLEHFEYLFDS